MSTISKNDLLQAYPFFNLTDMGRLKCSLTGHEIVDSLKSIQDYISTRKFKRALEIEQIKKEYGQYLGTIENTERLYCKVTMRDIESDPASLKKHFEGKRFKRRLPIYLEKLEKGEPMCEGSDTDSEGSSQEDDISFDERRKLCAVESASETEEEKSVNKLKGKLTKMEVLEDVCSSEDEEMEEEEVKPEPRKVQKRKIKVNNLKRNKKVKAK